MTTAVACKPVVFRSRYPLAHASTLAGRQSALAVALGRCRNAQERLAWLVDRARQRPSLPDDLRTAAQRVPGCLSQLWLAAEFRDGRCWFCCDSDSQVVRAMALLVAEVYSGCTPAEILDDNYEWLAGLGWQQLLTPNRRNAQARTWEQIRAFAASQLGVASASPAGETG